eukprot:335132_1
MNGILIVLCAHIQFSILNALERIVNPGNGSLIHCGVNEDCNIICNQDNICKDSTFYVYNYTITILCSGVSSCQNTDIISSNVQSLNIVFNATFAFKQGRLHTNPTDTNVHVKCSNPNACYMPWFSYQNQGITTHTCENRISCRAARIHALSAVSVTCGSDGACQRLGIVLPPNKTSASESLITLSGNTYASATTPISIKSLFPFQNFNCINNCSLDFVYVVYGLQFDKYCVASDTLCLDSMENTDDLTIIDTYLDGYPENLDYSAYQFNNDVLILATFPSNEGLTFIPPSMNGDVLLSMLCLTCNYISLNLSSIENMVLTSAVKNSVLSINVFGSQNYFKLNSYDLCKDNTFNLEATNKITLNSVAKYGTVYLGNRLDVTINCGANPLYPCASANIYSSLQPSELRLGLGNGYWNLNCAHNPLTIHFDQYLCIYQNYTSNCTFMTLTPTVDPTQETWQPTRTHTINPTQHPTTNPAPNPTVNPTYQPPNPTVNPTYQPPNPTVNPTYQPPRTPSTNPTDFTLYPTENPTKNPIVNPSTFPTDDPSMNPTNMSVYPTEDPTKDPIMDPTTSPVDETPTTPSKNPAVGPTGSVLVATNHPSTSGSTRSRVSDVNNQKDGIDYMDWVLIGFAIACLVCIIVIVWVVCTISKGKKSQKMHDNRNSIEAKEVIEIQVLSMNVRKTLMNGRSIKTTALQPVVNNNLECEVIGSHVTIGGDVFDLSHVNVDNHSLLNMEQQTNITNIQAEGDDSDDSILANLPGIETMGE